MSWRHDFAPGALPYVVGGLSSPCCQTGFEDCGIRGDFDDDRVLILACNLGNDCARRIDGDNPSALQLFIDLASYTVLVPVGFPYQGKGA